MIMMLRAVIALSAALILSAGVNIWQYGKIRADAAREGARQMLGQQLDQIRAHAEALAEARAQADHLADMALSDRAQLMAELRALAERSRERVTVYRDRVGALPPAPCAPGIERMDAINALLEAEP